ncbi:cobaltochelatase subunit CobN [Pseudomonas sp. MYb185]|uniref:cobaltochelatase subunit CobN n=1 Tax=Pseudomonas sp. MYb185 TaxID=1848729 RepID=UPI000CFD0EA5|nr:cobaltochelatase subunit CobN [Pseudomonas sp. MYb185]PRB83917.1 cobaltochelatase subunit CobN [Pseudomonas sp. MYb185]
MGRLILILLLLTGGGSQAWAEAAADIRVLSNDFVLPGKVARLQQWAGDVGLTLDNRYISGEADSAELAAGLLILDTPRPNDLAQMQAFLGDRLEQVATPWIRVGGGPPAFGNLPPQHARQLIGYYGNGGQTNLRRMFDYWQALRSGEDPSALPPPQSLPTVGFYHPAAPILFDDVQDYLRWGSTRWPGQAPRVGFIIHGSSIADAELALLDELIDASESRGQAPLVFWVDGQDPQALSQVAEPAELRALVNLTHLQNGAARQAEFLALGIPVLQSFIQRSSLEDWRQSPSGIATHAVAPLLGVPETWGLSDPLVIGVVEQGEPKLIREQAAALLDKIDRLVRLQDLPPAQKQLALLFWNHPDGERNLAASHLNVPRSLAALSTALAEAGYRIPAVDEEQFIALGQRLLGGYYRPETLATLHSDGLAAAVPLSAYQQWLQGLDEALQQQLQQRWGDPASHWAVQQIDGQPHFIIPRAQLGNLLLMPQPPRAGRPGEAYHDTAVAPDHIYLAAYLLIRGQADALIHFGTHGTQEWLPGKDRGLAVTDYPFLALGDLPVFYPYIQDNIGEAIQARRRGRAVVISHQTPAFAPAGLYDELRDLHDLIHQYQQLEEGAVREQTADAILEQVAAQGMLADLGWDAGTAKEDFTAFFAILHDHLHELAADSLPLGLHTYGEPAAAEHRLSTVLQQLGEPFRQAVAVASGAPFDSGEPEALDFAELQNTPAYRLLEHHLLQGAPIERVEDAALRDWLLQAREHERNLAKTGEVEALLDGLGGGFVAPGPGGDPVRNPQVPSGRNLYAFEADKLPTATAYAAGEEALEQLLQAYRDEHHGQTPDKLAFSLWSSEAMRHLGILESQVLHALGLRPRWDDGGRVRALEIIPRSELGRPRIDVVLQVTSVYRDQFDGFMNLLADAIERLAQLDEADNPVAANSRALAARLQEQGLDSEPASQLASIRIFGNAPGDYGSGVSQLALDSTRWEDDSVLAEQFLQRLQHGYGSAGPVGPLPGGNLFAEQLKGVQAAVLARSSTVNGLLSTDHPFEYLGGLSQAVRQLNGEAPALYIADLRQNAPRTTGAARFLASELRSRYLNPQWIDAMQQEGYAGTLELLNIVNNLWGWQAADSAMVRADQWQAVHDTYVQDQRELGLGQWFEQHNPTAQAQLIERMVEAIRKDYWDADEQTRRELVERWQELTQQHGADSGAALTVEFINDMAAGFGLGGAAASEPQSRDRPAEQAIDQPADSTAVRGQVLQEVTPQSEMETPWRIWAGLLGMLGCILVGAWRQQRANRNTSMNTPEAETI